MRKPLLLVASVVALAALPGCQLFFLPCYVCAACASAGGGGSTVDSDPAGALPEVKLNLQRHTAVTPTALAH